MTIAPPSETPTSCPEPLQPVLDPNPTKTKSLAPAHPDLPAPSPAPPVLPSLTLPQAVLPTTSSLSNPTPPAQFEPLEHAQQPCVMQNESPPYMTSPQPTSRTPSLPHDGDPLLRNTILPAPTRFNWADDASSLPIASSSLPRDISGLKTGCLQLFRTLQ